MAVVEKPRMRALTREGEVRRLTMGEIALARTVFGSYIDYSRVWIHLGSYLPFGLQNVDTGMTPSGELYFRGKNYADDFSTASNPLRHLFIHEMTHVWQYQNGMWVKLRGCMSWAVDYHYDFKGRIRLAEYSMEQQAAIIADYFYFSEFGEEEWQGNEDLYYNGEYLENTYSYYKLLLTDFPSCGGTGNVKSIITFISHSFTGGMFFWLQTNNASASRSLFCGGYALSDDARKNGKAKTDRNIYGEKRGITRIP